MCVDENKSKPSKSWQRLGKIKQEQLIGSKVGFQINCASMLLSIKAKPDAQAADHLP